MSVKLFIILLIGFVSVALTAYTQGHDGKPGCQSQEELERPWRNNFDPTRYWVCEEIGKPATEVLCPSVTGYLDEEEKCVPWEDWIWTEPYDPPTKA